ncbi:MAG: hypothetical protein IPM29_07195 [Planctomycetes bacterium]|nr:hypothetical protein [Planctomycetota bacterium]
MTSTLRISLALAVALPWLAAAAVAQTTPEVLGLTDTAPQLARIDPGFCTLSLCPPAIGPSVSPWAGGVAHDPGDRATWLSEGLTLTKVDARNTCVTVCGPFPAPNLPAGVVVTGLAYNEALGRLFVSHSDNTIWVYQVAGGCTLSLLNSCTLTVPTNHIVSGLATSDPNGLLFYASSPWLGFGAPTEIHVAFQGSPCTPICPATIPSNTAGIVPDITGLGYDACRSELYFTDGGQVYGMQFAPPCSLTQNTICTGVPGQLLTGLCVLPSTETTSGNPCFSGSSPLCTTMTHVLRGDPAIGNLTFALDALNTPAPSIAMVFIDIGANCASANFGLCSLLPSIPVWASMTFVPGTGCNGTATFPLPLPANAALCGLILSSRWAGWMFPGGPLDHYVTDCQTWMVSAS